MTLVMLMVGYPAAGTVDRIEGRHAVVEWRRGCLSDVPLRRLPRRAREGDRVIVRLRRFPFNAHNAGGGPALRTPRGWSDAAIQCLLVKWKER